MRMGKWIKIGSFAAIGAIAVVVAGVAILASLDFNSYKPLIEDAVEKATGRDVKLAGDLELNISLSPSLSISDVTFANADWGSRKDMAILKKLEAEVALLPLLSGEVDIKRLILAGLDVIAETDKTGKGNWEFAASSPAAASAPDSSAGFSARAALPVVNDVHVEDVTVTYKDGVTGFTQTLNLETLTVTADSKSAPLKFAVNGVINGAAFKVDGAFGSIQALSSGQNVDVDLTFAALGVDGSAKGRIGSTRPMGGLDLTVSARGASVKETLSEASKLAPGLREPPAADLGPFDVKATLKGGFEELALSGLRLTAGTPEALKIGVAGSVRNVFAQSGLDIDVSVEGASIKTGFEIVQKFAPVLHDIAAPDLGAFSGAVKIQGSAAEPSIPRLKFHLGKGRVAVIDVAGEVLKPLKPAGIDVTVKAVIRDVAGLASVAGAEAPVLPPLDVSFRVRDDKGAYRASDIGLKLGESRLEGSARLDLLGERPAVAATIRSALIDLDELLPKREKSAPEQSAATGGGEGTAEGDDRIFPDNPLPLGGLKAADVSLDVGITKLKARGSEFDGVAVKLDLAGGKLNVKSVEAVYQGAKMTADMSLDAARATPALAARLKISRFDYGKLLADRGHPDIVTGKVDVDAAVSAAGGSVRSLMAGLDGEVRVASVNGSIENGALELVSKDILGGFPIFQSEEDRVLKCAVVHADLKKGRAKLRSFVSEAAGLSVVVVGGVDLRNEMIALVIEPRAKKASLLGLIPLVPINVGGTLAKPDIDVSTKDVVEAAVGSVARGVAAFATFGLSVAAEHALSAARSSIDNTDYCRAALAGEAVTPSKLETAEKSSGGGAPSGSSQGPAERPKGSVVEEGLRGVGNAIGKGLGGLFGN